MKQNKSEAPVRLFIVLELPENVRHELGVLCHQLDKQKLFDGRCTKQDNLHLTLKFLGQVSPDLIPAIDERLKTVSWNALDVSCGDFGVLLVRKQPSILFVDLICPQLTALAQCINELLADMFEPEARPFTSHVTIARLKKVHHQDRFIDDLKKFVIPPMKWQARLLVLQSSVLSDDGPTYEVIRRYSLS